MSDYQKGKIYKLWSPSKNLVYYGSSVQTLKQILNRHKHKKTCTSSLILDCDDYKIELVEEYPCDNKQQLLKKEGEYIRENECVNMRIEGRTIEEYNNDNREQKSKTNKKLYQKNKDKRNKQNNQWRKNNKDKVSIARKILYETKKQNNAIYKWLLMIGLIQ